ncbi:RsmB/NOP family class I SAM-dependent RNA methyltransferase, partial [Bifidobacterium bifidum]|nr:RsmB/NOP family class I SAM-dependent RNA methyltransferase [Bifidobacterium bifidum]
MLVGEFADPQPGERVLDLCAAPGGKSTHLIAKMNDQGLLVANEIFKNRAQVLAENLERWGAKHVVVANESPDQLEKQFPAFFDRILVDAPCSGEGMFRKEPAGIEYWNEDYPAECANRQRHILTSALKMLKPGGTLVYSTCTFAPEEDEQMA